MLGVIANSLGEIAEVLNSLVMLGVVIYIVRINDKVNNILDGLDSLDESLIDLNNDLDYSTQDIITNLNNKTTDTKETYINYEEYDEE